MGGQGAHGRISGNDGGRIPGNQDSYVFLGRSRGFPAQADVPDITRQPCTQPHCLALGSRFQSQSTAPPSHFPQNYDTPPSHPNLFSSPPPNPCPCNNICPCHRLPPTPPSFLCRQAKILIRVRRLWWDPPFLFLILPLILLIFLFFFILLLFCSTLGLPIIDCIGTLFLLGRKGNDEAMTKSGEVMGWFCDKDERCKRWGHHFMATGLIWNECKYRFTY